MNDNFTLHLRRDICTQCGLCADSCPFGVISMDGYPRLDESDCRLCGTCVQTCPVGAWVMDEAVGCVQKDEEPAAGVWVLAETENGSLSHVTKELLGKASELAAKLQQKTEAVLVGKHASEVASELVAYGADRVHLLESDGLAAFIEENYAEAVAQLVRRLHPAILLVGATPRGRGLSARLAALLHTGLTADCTRLDIDPEKGLLQQIRPAFGGNLMATITTPYHRPQMASVRPGIMTPLVPDGGKTGEVVRHDMSSLATDARIRLLGEEEEETSGDSLNDSRVIIGVGRGVKKKETLELIHRWADRIGAVVAGSRAAVEAGLVDAHLQIGQTGHTISPDVYIAIGISGQIQHTSAIGGAKKIIAINPDASAPIFKVADYGWAVPAEEALVQLLGR